MIVVFHSLDTSLAQEKSQGALQSVVLRYTLFKDFDKVVILTQDSQKIDDGLGELVHVPCVHSRFKTVQKILQIIKPVKWIYFSFSSFIWLLRNRSEIKLLIAENVDSPSPCIFSEFFNVPYFIHYHYDVSTQVGKINKDVINGIVLSVLEKLCFKHAKRLWATSATLIDKAKAFGAPKVTLVPNWIDFSEAPQINPKESAAQLTNILFVGRLHPVKRVHLLIEAFAKLRITHPYSKLIIIGDGEERQRLEALTKSLNLEDYVSFLGFQNHEKVLEVMKKSDLLVLPSLIEGNPRVLIEAMMMKLPIVAANVPGIADMVKHAVTGHLVSDLSPETLALGMGYVLNDSSYVRRLVDNAYEFAKLNYSKQQVFKKVQADIFSEVPAYRKTFSRVS